MNVKIDQIRLSVRKKKLDKKDKENNCKIHEWKFIGDRIHNKGDGKSKYKNYK